MLRGRQETRPRRRCEVAFPDRIGPFAVPGAGHFLPWERAEPFNGAVAAFFADLIQAGAERART
jgi:pimeloyl-ACP methyl ester carboxylesterase